MSRPSSTAGGPPVAPTVPPVVYSLANPTPRLLDAQLPGYLLPCVLDLVRDSTRHVVQRKIAEEQSLRDEGLLPSSASGSSMMTPGSRDKGKGRMSAEEEERLVESEALKRVERMGLMVGGFIAEKLTLSRAPFPTHLDIIKFVCKDIFLHIYSKQIDNLRTNHRGVYVLQSHAFPPLVPLSSCRGAASDAETAKAQLVFPQAVIQGALARLGMPAIVTAETSGLPQCTFQVRTVKSTQLGTPGTTTTPAMGGAGQGQGQGHDTASARHSQAPGSASTGLGIAGA